MRRHMRRYPARILILAYFLLGTVSRALGKDEVAGPEALISRARVQEELWVDGTPPTLLRASIQVFDAKGAVSQGQYTFRWVSPSRWREEIRFGNYGRLRVGNAKGYWQKSELGYQPEVIFHLDRLLQLKTLFKVSPKHTFGKVKHRDKDGIGQSCTDLKWATTTDRILCFSDASGVLLSVEYPKSERQRPPEISRIEYGEFNIVSGKLVPHEIRALRDQKVALSVKVLEIGKITEENADLFSVPANSEFWAHCDEMQDIELVDHVSPQYPSNARSNHEQGRVVFYAVIEADGSLSHLTLIQRATPALESAAVAAIRQWHYKPASCAGILIRMETSISTDFSLQF